jgi:tetraacyldisaccharide 4'-kinase
MAGRRATYALGARRARRPAVPTVAVGGLTVGGAGKTPVASWIAGFFMDRDIRAGIVLRGVGGDEVAVHRRLVSGAVVVEDPNRFRGCVAAVERGARVLVLDDAFQRLDVARDVDIVVIATESLHPSGLLPSGPWREPLAALRHADLVVITRKAASLEAARAAAQRVWSLFRGGPIAIAALQPVGFRRLTGNGCVGTGELAGARILASAGVADPWTFAAQCRGLGAAVTLLPWPDHYAFTARDVSRLASLASTFDYVVVTEKDAVKLEPIWPVSGPDPLVSRLELTWEDGRGDVETLLSRLSTVSYGPIH